MAQLPFLLGGDNPEKTRKRLLRHLDGIIEEASERIREGDKKIASDQYREELLTECCEEVGPLSADMPTVLEKVTVTERHANHVRESLCRDRRAELTLLKTLRGCVQRHENALAVEMLIERRQQLEEELLSRQAYEKTWNILCNVYGPDQAHRQLWIEMAFLETCIQALSVSIK